ncbi:inositol monophosphatase family protein [Hippea alviniae]|uniref:inositol monophosphatase family protein n=1 Tax=Hippea alviniae TaxID=1279027 RepID=UPI0003B5204A|nr:inositol monophosphatase family protein [Hippea alviniae]
MREIVESLKEIAKEIHKNTIDIIGSKKAKEIIGKGEFGDNTVYIDKISEDMILEGLQKIGKCCVLTEEKGVVDFGADYPKFIVDPIDGSLNAKRGIPYYSISIGVAFGEGIKDIKCGYVVNLATMDEFWAIEGEGAFFNGLRIKPDVKDVKVVAVEGLKRETPKDLVADIFRKFYRVRQVGSTALDMCYTALGAFDAFLHLDKARIIDYAAAKVIIEESGGGLFEWLEDREFSDSISLNKSKSFIAVPDKRLIDKVIKVLKND